MLSLCNQTFFKKRLVYWPLLLVIVIATVVATRQFSNTWLTGWDTLHPEFDYSLHFMRSFNGVWREDQGLGTVAAHSHMSDLPRIAIMYLLDIFFPTSLIKQLFVLLTLVIGPVGVYFFSLQLIEQLFDIKNVKNHTKLARIRHAFKKSSHTSVLGTTNQHVAAGLAALWYLLNLGTMQHYIVVFEMFAVQFAAIGWLFYLVTRYLIHKKTSDLWWFFVVSFLASSMAYASLLWFAYAASLALYCGVIFLLSPSVKRFWQLLLIGITSFAANAYWLLPNLYFLLSEASSYSKNSHMNRLFSPEAFYQNQAFGQIENISLLKNFLFNWFVFDSDSFIPLLQVWIQHIQNPIVLVIGYLTASFILFGGVFSVVKGMRKRSFAIALVPVWMFSGVMLINQNYIFAPVFAWLREQSEMFEEGLRFPFTKFSIIFILISAVFLAYFFMYVFNRIDSLKQKKLHTQFSKVLISVLFLTSLFLFSAPTWRGQLIHPIMNVDIPQAYFEAFSFAKTLPKQSRIAILPLETHSGWHTFDWGHLGPGFWWFGLEQPVLTRDFDRWSPYNETFYNQLSTGFYNNDPNQALRTLSQFDVDYFLLDTSIYVPGRVYPYSDVNRALDILADISAQKIFESGNIQIYEMAPSYSEKTPNDSFVYSPEIVTLVASNTVYSRFDPIFTQFGAYLSPTTNSQNTIVMPFSDLFTLQQPDITVQDNSVHISKALSDISVGKTYQLFVPQLNLGDKYQTTVFTEWSNETITFSFPDASLQNGSENIQLPHLPTFQINTSELDLIKTDELLLNINSEPVFLEKNEQKATPITLFVGDPLNVNLVNSIDSEIEESTIFINEVDSLLISVTDAIWNPLLQPFEKTLTLQNPTVTAKVSTFGEKISLESDNFTNCDHLDRGSVEKNLANDTYVFVSDEYGVGCDYVNLPSTNTQHSYVLNWQKKNREGRNIKFYLTHSQLNKQVIEELLPSDSTNSNYLSFPFTQRAEGIYSLHWENRSFGQRSENSIEKVSLYPIPAIELSRIQLRPASDISESIINTKIDMSSVSKYSTALYKIQTTSDLDIHQESHLGLIVLSQGYNQGWVGLAFDGSHPMPKILPHTQYNSWANAWEVHPKDQTIILIFWPQILSTIGFLAGGITVLVFSLAGLKAIHSK